MASREKLLSDKRKEFLVLVAVELRSMFCNSGGAPLITNAQLESDLIFPLHDKLTPFNELSDMILVGTHCKDKKCTFQTAIELDGTQVAVTWLSYQSWINQIVIDLKVAEYAPLTREEVIKIVADRNGAHVDPRIHEFVGLIETTNVMPFNIVINGESCEADCSNLLCETICSIANEVVYAYKYVFKPRMSPRNPNPSLKLRVFDYTSVNEKSNKETKRYKYTICSSTVNLYNTNKFYECKITSHPFKAYDMVFKERVFPVDVIRIEDCSL